MYSSIASLHIALDSRLLLLNSNRKVSIHPEQYDMAINDAISTVLKQRFSPELNSKKQGLEESIKRYTDLASLKREVVLPLMLENNNQYFYIPSDCKFPINCTIESKFQRDGIFKLEDNITPILPTDLILYQSIVKIVEPIPTSVTILLKDLTYSEIDISTITKSNKSLYLSLNYLKEYIEEELGLYCYIENFNNIYKNRSLIIITDDASKQLDTSSTNLTVSNSSFTKKQFILPNSNISKNVDLVSSENFEKNKNDYYLSKNIHLNPFYKIVNNKGIIRTNSQFKIKSVTLEYIKYPRLVNSALNRMTDMTITDEILDIATTNLSGILENTTYQINKQQEQFNN